MNVYFYTLGCRVNQYETDAVRKLCEEAGYVPVTSAKEADIIIVNTCSVTGEADRKSRQQIRHMRSVNPKAIICAMGCHVEVCDGKVEADVICGTKDKYLLVSKIKEYIASNCSGESFVMHTRPEVSKSDVYHEFGTVLSPEGTRAFVKIEDGCNNFCTYCIIPYARGRVVSRDEQNILCEVKELANRGYREVVLTGIHICSYGKDRGEGPEALLRLVEKINDINEIERIRLGSLEPMSLTPEFIEGLSHIQKLCPHFHLSLQSGSDTVLKRMNRKYDCQQYEERVNMLREFFPHMSLTTDVICGFPGETEEEFNATYDFVKRLRFSKLHVFPYSIREGTVAAGMEQVPKNIAKERTGILTRFSSEAENEFAASFEGEEVTVLIEAAMTEIPDSLKEGCFFSGYTEEYVHAAVRFDNEEEGRRQIGKTVHGKIIEIFNNLVVVST
ncbi:MAG: tRNA (N(6)-L-threonylcarbamoyladenosine(37)-C(2))-methylthiotransferase MtaB [Clostridia bacterium]|nr:tRNA (N(6)-L-threonylcarbamoyladenosine(37)-C(2))-methylthiotransferase MtaB [Clostridia bacterium]